MRFKNQFAMLKVIVRDLGSPYILKRKKTVNSVFASLLNADYIGVGCVHHYGRKQQSGPVVVSGCVSTFSVGECRSL